MKPWSRHGIFRPSHSSAPGDVTLRVRRLVSYGSLIRSSLITLPRRRRPSMPPRGTLSKVDDDVRLVPTARSDVRTGIVSLRVAFLVVLTAATARADTDRCRGDIVKASAKHAREDPRPVRRPRPRGTAAALDRLPRRPAPRRRGDE